MPRFRIACGLLIACLLFSPSVLAQGSLTPPGPTMVALLANGL